MSALQSNSPIPVFKKIQQLFGVFGFVGGVGLAYALFTDIRSFFASFTFGFLFWMILTIGAMTLTFLHHSIRAKWSLSILRVVESANKTVVPMFVFWVVLAIGMWIGELYLSPPGKCCRAKHGG
jgi:hypothetical protein